MDGLSVGNATAVAVNNSVEVSLVGVPDKTRVKISLTGVNSILNPNVSIGLLVGGVSGNASVSSADLSGVRLHSGQTTNINNFKFDLNTSGAINASDVSGLKARIGATMK